MSDQDPSRALPRSAGPSRANPYAAPVSEVGPAGRTLVLSDEVRSLVGRTSLLMIIAACMEMAASTLGLLTGEIDMQSVVSSSVFLIAPMFVLLAGVSLRRLIKPGDDHAALQIGLRNLFVVFLIRGLAMLLLVAGGVLSMAFVFSR